MTGTLHVVGLGPGDPELMTLRAARLLAESPVVAFFARSGAPGHARTIAGDRLRPDVVELRLEYPFTTELDVSDPRYGREITAFYDREAERLADHLRAGRDVALLAEGDPFFYGSSMVLFDRLHARFPASVVPGVTGMSGCWAEARLPMLHGDDVLSVLPGTLSEDRLAERLRAADAAVVMKLGRNLPKVRAALERAGLTERALYVERGTMAGSRIVPAASLPEGRAPYFSLVLVPGRQRSR